MTAAASQDVPRQVEVVYSNIGPAEAWRVGDECYVAPNIITAWHWPFTVSNGEATIQAEGRTIRVQLKTVHQRDLFPVKAIVEQLGAICKWQRDDQMEVLGEVRIVAFANNELSIDTTISSKPHVFSLQDPGRLVVDMRGMLLGSHVVAGLPPNVQASQYGPDTVRIVYDAEDVPRIETSIDDATRHFAYKVAFPKKTPFITGHPPLVNTDEDSTDNQGEAGRQDPTPQTQTQQPPAQVSANQPVITAETNRLTSLTIPLSTPLTAPIRWQRQDLFTFEVTLPGVHFSGPVTKPASAALQVFTARDTGDASVLRVTTTHPMGIEVSQADTGIILTMRKPSGSSRLTGRTIVVDPGHGGKDSGAKSPAGDVMEKQLTLEIGQDLAASLSSAGATVIMTRNSDVFIPLSERPAIANRSGADLFISVHINSNAVSGSRSGTTTYFHGSNPNSKQLAECVEHEVGLVSGLPVNGVASDTSRYKSGFAVLRGAKMPAILIETGYINTMSDRNRMMDPTFQKEMAQAVVQGVKEFLGDAKQEDSQ